MRVGLDGTPLLGRRTGIGWYTSELVRAMAAQAPDDDFVLLAVSWRRPGTLSDVVGRNVRASGLRLPARPLWELWHRLPVPRLEWLVRTDVFHATNFLAPPTRSVPIVVTVHDLGFVRYPDTCLPATRRFAELLPPVLRRAQAIITLSEFGRDDLANWLPDVAPRTTVIPQGPHRRAAPRPGPAVTDGPPYALFVGTLDPRRNLPLLLDAFKDLRARGVEMRLVLAGQASPLLDVGRLIADRGLEGVIVTGYVPDEVASALLRDARMLVFPSGYEGFGMPLVEAMAAGVPVVALRAGPTPEVTGDAAVLVDPGDAGALSHAIERVAGDDGLRATLREEGTRRAAKFDWRESARATLAVYGRVKS